MKKNLFFIRHAEAETEGSYSVLRDYDRELTSKGIMQAAKAGIFLKELNINIDCIYTSGAKRASDTANYLAEQLGFDNKDIHKSEVLYGNGPRGYLETVNQIDKDSNNAIIIGHNPDITYFVEYLIGNSSGPMGNATIIQMQFENLNWDEISQKSGNFIQRTDI